MASIRMRGLVKKYGETVVIPGLDLDIPDREFVVFVGPSGCGKSTLLRLVAGLESANAGDLFIGDVRVNSIPAAQRNIAMVFQDYALYPHMNVYQNMAFSLETRKLPRAEIRERVSRVAGTLHIDGLLHHKPKELSGGQRQRVAMGRAMVREPQVFLFDEPLSNLDAKLRAEVRTEIKALARQLNTTIVFVTHDQVEAMTLADRIVVIRGGVIQQTGSPKEVYDRPTNRFVAGFIGSPTMNFFPVRLQGGHAHLADGSSLSLPAPLREAVQRHAAMEGVLGVRSEHVLLDPPEHCGFEVVVSVVEPLGSDTLMHFDFQGARHVARISPDARVEPGDRIVVAFDMAKVHLFAPGDSGAALR